VLNGTRTLLDASLSTTRITLPALTHHFCLSHLHCISREEFLLRNAYGQREDKFQYAAVAVDARMTCPVYPSKVKAGICGCGGVDVHMDLDGFYDGDNL